MFRTDRAGAMCPAMEKEQISQGQPETTATSPVDDLTVDLESTNEVTQRGQSVIELSRELTSSSKALLEELDSSI